MKIRPRGLFKVRVVIHKSLCALLALSGLLALCACGEAPESPKANAESAPLSSAMAAPLSGSTPWMILLCTPSDDTVATVTPAYYRSLFIEHNTAAPTAHDYWWQLSDHMINLTGSNVSTRWFATSKTLSQLQREPRIEKIRDCAASAETEVGSPDSYYGVIAMFNVFFGGSGDSGATSIGPSMFTLNGVTKPYAQLLLEPWALDIQFIAHEMGHGYGLEDSFSTAATGCGGVPMPGEYCDQRDIMSASNVLGFHDPKWFATEPDGSKGDLSGPGLNAFNLIKLGWIPASRQFVYSGRSEDVMLSAIGQQLPKGYLVARVPIGSEPQHYYTIEFRRKTGWDRGLPEDAVLIHEVKPDPVPDHTTPLSYILTSGPNLSAGAAIWQAGQTFRDTKTNVSIRVDAIDTAASIARIHIEKLRTLPGGIQ